MTVFAVSINNQVESEMGNRTRKGLKMKNEHWEKSSLHMEWWIEFHKMLAFLVHSKLLYLSSFSIPYIEYGIYEYEIDHC